MPTRSRLLVIDANILRAAGSDGATHPLSSRCRNILRSVLDICHRCVVTAELADEWGRHASRYGTLWRTQMASRRKLLPPPPLDTVSLLAGLAVALSEPTARIAQKDFHLVRAAMAADWIILSLDAEARGVFAAAAVHLRQFGRICWADPDRHGDTVLTWLKGDQLAPREWNLDPERERP